MGSAVVLTAVVEIALGHDPKAPTVASIRLSVPLISYTRSRARIGRR
jgi:hypothetical protein